MHCPAFRPLRTRLAQRVAALVALALAGPLVGCQTNLEQRLRRLELEADRQEVVRLIHQYAHGLDGQDPALLARTFTADAIAEYKGVNFPMDERLTGFPAIHAWLDRQTGRREGALPWHYMDTHLVDVQGDRATLKTFQHNRHLSAIGVYTVDAVRTPLGWRIQKLHLDERILDPELLERMQRNPTTPGSKPSAAVEETEKRFVSALAGRIGDLEGILARDFVYSTSAGTILGKKALIDYLRSGATRVDHIVRDEVQIAEREGLIVTTGRLIADIRQDGKARTVRSRYLHVWIPTADGWQLLARQAAALPTTGS